MSEGPGIEQFVASGLYDPAAPGAAERLELLAYLSDAGATLDEMVRAHAEGRLFGLAGDRLIRPGRDAYTWRQVAERVQLTLESVQGALRSYGIPYVGADVPFASDSDVELMRGFAIFANVAGEETALGLARVLGGAMSKVAEAASQTVRGSTPDLQLDYSPSQLATAQAYAAVALQVPILGGQLDPLFRHHLVIGRRHFEATDSADIASTSQMRVSIGFADLSGFTELSERISPAELSHLITQFETQVTHVVDHFGGRVVKFIGDEVMFVTAKAEQAAQIALAISRGAPPELPARVGLAYGACLATDGDYFGPPVNLASRLVDHALPGEVLADPQLAERLKPAEGWLAVETRTLDVRGIAAAVAAVVIDHQAVSVEAPLQ